MGSSSPSLQRFVRRALLDAAGGGSPHPAQLASAFDALCGLLRDRLHPLFGARAVGALFLRARHLASTEYAWLADTVPTDGGTCDLGRIRDMDRTLLESGFAALLAHNIALLIAFVGEDLVLPLVQQAWGNLTQVEALRTEGDQ